jgi:hypothetical protein
VHLGPVACVVAGEPILGRLRSRRAELAGGLFQPPFENVELDFGVDLHPVRRLAVTIGLQAKCLAGCEEPCACWKLEAFAVPMIDVQAVGQIPVGTRCRGDAVVTGLVQSLGVRRNRRAQATGEHLRAETDAKERCARLVHAGDPVELLADKGEMFVVGAHRSIEDHHAGVIGGFGQRFAGPRTAFLDAPALCFQRLGHLARARVPVVDDAENALDRRR